MPLEFVLKGLTRRTRVLVSLSSNLAATTSYEFTTRSLTDAILSRPDIQVRSLRVAQSPQPVCEIRFPAALDTESRTWRPRMCIKYSAAAEFSAAEGGADRDEVVLKNGGELGLSWTADIDGRRGVWGLSFCPFLLTLRSAVQRKVGEREEVVLAVFELRDWWGRGLSMDLGGLCIMDEVVGERGVRDVVCTLVGVLVYWERAGKMAYIGQDAL
ncbi:hypothetical protein VTL71DRAFT_15877 [Oculimacula yallundae]|uniref:Uncharacterized protein n=1 Tax=Oculimacula yallundae TaxID=86028 RepID=A0ABR4CCV6_9HELO